MCVQRTERRARSRGAEQRSKTRSVFSRLQFAVKRIRRDHTGIGNDNDPNKGGHLFNGKFNWEAIVLAQCELQTHLKDLIEIPA
jgi:hypothetical protein